MYIRSYVYHISIIMKPYIKGQYCIITTIPLCRVSFKGGGGSICPLEILFHMSSGKVLILWIINNSSGFII